MRGSVQASAFTSVAGDGTFLPAGDARYGFFLLGALPGDRWCRFLGVRETAEAANVGENAANQGTRSSAGEVVALVAAIIQNFRMNLEIPDRIGTEDWWNVVALGTVA